MCGKQVASNALRIIMIFIAFLAGLTSMAIMAPAGAASAGSLDMPVYAYPQNNASGVELNPQIIWRPVSAPDGAVVFYVFKMWKDGTLTNYREGTFVPYENTFNSSPNVIFESGNLLDAGTEYTWQVIAKDSNGNTSEGAVYSFTTDTGGALRPMPVSPSIRGTVNTTRPTFRWTPSVLPGGGNPSHYQVQVFDNKGVEVKYFSVDYPATSGTFPVDVYNTLKPYNTYRWYVWAYGWNGGSRVALSSNQSEFLISYIPQINEPVITWPKDGAVNVPSGKLLLQWEKCTDYIKGNVDHFIVEIAANYGLLASIDVLGETSLLINDIRPDSIYSWRVTGAGTYKWGGKDYDVYKASLPHTFSTVQAASVYSRLALSAPPNVETGSTFSVGLNLALKNAGSSVNGVQTEISYDPTLVEYAGITAASEFSALNIKARNVSSGVGKSRLVISGIADTTGISVPNDTEKRLASVKFKVLAAGGTAIILSQKDSVDDPGVIFADKTKSVPEVNEITVKTAALSSVSSQFTMTAPRSVNAGSDFTAGLNMKLRNAVGNVNGVQTEIAYDASLVEYAGITPAPTFSSLNIQARNVSNGAKSRVVVSGVTDGAGVKVENDAEVLLASLKFNAKGTAGSLITLSQKNGIDESAVIFSDKSKSIADVGEDLTIDVVSSGKHVVVKSGETLILSADDVYDSLTVMNGGHLIVKDGVTLRIKGEIVFEDGSDVTVSGGGVIRGDKYKVESINVRPEVGDGGYVLAGENRQFVAEISPIYAANKDISWSASSPIISVDASGLVTAGLPEKRMKDARIAAAALDGGGAVGTFKVTVARPPIESLRIVPNAVQVAKGGTKDLYEMLTVDPAMALKPDRTNLVWASSNPDVSVGADGVVTMPDSNVSAVITMTYNTPYSDEKNITASCAVYTPGSAQGITLKLQTKLEGRPSGGASSGNPLANEEKMALEIYNASNALIWSGTASADAAGAAEYTVESGVLSDGDNVKLWIKGERYLADLESHVVDIENGVWNVVMDKAARGGDADGDNSIYASDFGILKQSFLKSKGDKGYNWHADFDGDDNVYASDFGMLKKNFLLSGSTKPLTKIAARFKSANRNGTLAEALGITEKSSGSASGEPSNGCNSGLAALSLAGVAMFAIRRRGRK